MNKLNHSLPLAFLLALGADGSNAFVVDAKEPAPVLTQGMLSELLADMRTPSTGEPVQQELPHQMLAQFRNYGFANCFNGSWRNC